MTTTNRNLVEIVVARLTVVKLLVSRIDKAASDKLIEMITHTEKIFVTGQGRSGLVAQCLATRLAQMGLDVYIPGQATCRKIKEGDLLIAISCRGTTTTTVDFAQISRKAGAKIVAVTASDKSTLAEIADHTVLIPSNDEDIRAQCRYVVGPNNNTLFEETALLYADALVYILLEQEGISKNIINQQHTNLE